LADRHCAARDGPGSAGKYAMADAAQQGAQQDPQQANLSC